MPTLHETLLDNLRDRGEWYEALVTVALDQTHDLSKAIQLADEAWQHTPQEPEEVDLEEAGEGGVSGDTANINLQVQEAEEPEDGKVNPQQLDAFADLWASLHGPDSLHALADAIQHGKGEQQDLKEGFEGLEFTGEGSFGVSIPGVLDLMESLSLTGEIELIQHDLLEAGLPQPGQKGVSTNPQSKPVVKAPAAKAPTPSRQGVAKGDPNHAEHLGKIAQHLGFTGYMTDKLGRKYYFENGVRKTQKQAKQLGLDKSTKVKFSGKRKAGAGGELSETSKDAADDLITRIKRGDPTARHKKNISALAWHLANLSPEQLQELKAKHSPQPADPHIKEQVKTALQKSLADDDSWIKDLPQAVPLDEHGNPTKEPQHGQPEDTPPADQRSGGAGSPGRAEGGTGNEPGATTAEHRAQPEEHPTDELPTTSPRELSKDLSHLGVGSLNQYHMLSTDPERKGHNEQVMAAAKAGGYYIDPKEIKALSAPLVTGGEHDVHIDPQSGRVVKITKGNQFGFSNDVHKYLERVQAANFLWPSLGYKVHGVTTNRMGDAGVVTSMNYIEGTQPSEKEIYQWFDSNGWKPAENEDPARPMAWVDPKTGTEVEDAHEGNFIKTRGGEIVPIDVGIIPGKQLKEQMENEQRAQVPSSENKRGGERGSEGGDSGVAQDDTGTAKADRAAQPGTPPEAPQHPPAPGQPLAEALRSQGVDTATVSYTNEDGKANGRKVLEAAKATGHYITPEQVSQFAQGPDYGGGEHKVYLDDKTNRYTKITQQGGFGMNKNAEQYLARIDAANKLWPALDYKVHGVMEHPDGTAGIVTSMNRVEGDHPGQKEIDTWFKDKGWNQVTWSHDRKTWLPKEGRENSWVDINPGWMDPDTGMVIEDAHEGNFIKTKEGKLVPIDVGIHPGKGFTKEVPSPAPQQQAKAPAGKPVNERARRAELRRQLSQDNGQPPSEAERTALNSYVESPTINSALRGRIEGRMKGQPIKFDSELGQKVANLDQLLDRNTVPEGTVLYRGLKESSQFVAPELGATLNDPSSVGKSWVDHGYGSTTINPNVGKGFKIRAKDDVLKVVAGKSLRGRSIKDLSPKKNEDEVLLSRGIQYRIIGHESGMTVVEANSLPPEERSNTWGPLKK